MIDMKKIALITVAITLIIIGISVISVNLPSRTEVIQTQTQKTQTLLPQTSTPKTLIKLPAVDNQGNGVVTTLEVQAIPGEGKTLVDINQLFFWVDTQYSIRTAKEVAENITGIDLSKVDLVYDIETEASVIEGQSAGAALTIATVAVLQNKAINPNVIITGTINLDGSIGPVGAIFAKAKASKDAGATLFLVPEGQGIQTNYRPEQKCEKIGPITYCTTEYKPEKVDISKDVGIEVKEVSNVQEALKYFVE